MHQDRRQHCLHVAARVAVAAVEDLRDGGDIRRAGVADHEGANQASGDERPNVWVAEDNIQSAV